MKEQLLHRSSKMEVDYEHILNIDYDVDYKIPCVTSDSMVYSDNRESVLLNGEWNYTIDVFDTGIRKKFFEEVTTDPEGRKIPVDFSFDEWEKVSVPSHWNLVKPEYKYYEGSVWYTRKFLFDKQENKKYFLRIGAANNECRIWLNKKLVGRHIGGYTPFYVDITEELEDENRILIMVNNSRKLEGIPSINFDWFNYGGLYRNVEIISSPISYIKDFIIYLVPDNQYNKIKVKLKVVNHKPDDPFEVHIPELNINEKGTVGKDGTAEIMIHSNMDLWDHNNSKLYDVFVKYNEDSICDKVGFRQVEVKGNRIFLNGKDIFLKGICCHEESMINGRVQSEEEMLDIIRTAKEMNCNFIRLTHYPHNEAVAKLADQLGIMLWEEIPVYWALQFENQETYNNASNQLKELIKRDMNRASVILWSVGNENPDSDDRFRFMKNLIDICREMDETRLVSAACLVDIDALKIKDRVVEYIDIIGINEYYGWYYRDYNTLVKILENSSDAKPLLISETGGEAVPGLHGHELELYTEECQNNIYKKQFEMIDKFDYVRGISPWILYDYLTPVRLNHYQKGVNLKGIISKERDYKKLAYYTVKEHYSKK